MNSLDGLSNLMLEKVIFRHKKLSSFFKGCFAADRIPSHLTAPFAFIVNFEKSGERGSHWSSIVSINTETIEYFDSFGRLPPKGSIEKFIETFKIKIINRTSFQNPFSTVCGQYSVYYLVQRFLKISPNTIFETLKNSKNSDKLVNEYFLKLAN